MSGRRVRAVSVRWLAEAVHRQGDLYPYRGSDQLRAPTRSDEGIATQRRMQRDRPDDYRAEYSIRQRVTVGDTDFELRGRVDGVRIEGDCGLIEEFKTTRTDVDTVHAHDGAVHWAQTLLYAALLARELPGIQTWRLRLLYCHPATEAVRRYERTAEPAELDRFLRGTLERLRPAGQVHHEQARDSWLDARAFPFADFRPHQRAMARRCYRALKDREPLLIEAPTGSGKTMAVLYPALKNLAINDSGRVLFLTSRGTGARAARTALAEMDPGRQYLRHVSITAKDKACLVEGMPCSAERCRYARGYYEKRDAAVQALLRYRAIDAGLIDSIGRQFEVCPFELSLDAAVRADVVICDYNYVFDPIVRLQRFMADDEIDLLVDEAHQLHGRAAEMLSASLTRRTFRAALDEDVEDSIGKRLKSIDRALLEIRRRYGTDVETAIEEPAALTRAIVRFLDEMQRAEIELTRFPRLRTALFEAGRWLRSEGRHTAQACEYLLDTDGHGISIRSQCLDASRHIRDTFARYRSSIRFSGTLSPLELYNRLHGLDGAASERAASPFDERQLAVLLVRDIETYLRRREASLDRLVEAVYSVFSGHPGNYLVAFPSYAYLERFAAAASVRFPDGTLHCQTREMTGAEQDDFLQALQDTSQPRLAAIVLGGIFAESVDLAQVPLAGVIAVGVGVPPPSLARDLQRRYFDEKSGDGQRVAFLLPAMTRIVQAAGRLLRSPTQRGVVCLIDPRFGTAQYQQFFPPHWRPSVVGASDLGKAVAKFWEASMLPDSHVLCSAAEAAG